MGLEMSATELEILVLGGFFTELKDNNKKCRISSALSCKLTSEKAAVQVFVPKTLTPITVYTEYINDHATL